MILVTGANGFVGRHVVERLVRSARPVRAMVRDRRRWAPIGGVDVVEADLVQPATLPAAVAGTGTIVHCAAITANLREPYRGAYHAINATGTQNLVEAASRAGVGRWVLLSGIGTRPSPEGTYMATRWAMEEAVRSSGIPHVILQPSVQFGDGAEFVAALARLARRSPVLPLIGGGSWRCQPIWVEDVVSCVERSLEDETLLGRAIAIGGSEHVTLREVMRAIAGALGRRRLLVPLPAAVARLQARLLAALLAHPPLTPATLELFSADNATELDAVDRTFGFHPRGFREHLAAHGVEG